MDKTKNEAADKSGAQPALSERLLKQRTELLARPRSSAVRVSGASVIVFRAGAEKFALPLTEVADVQGQARCTPVPGAAAHIRGVMNHSNQIRPVYDLRALIGAEPAATDAPGYVLLFRLDDERLVGLHVDQVIGADEFVMGDAEDASRTALFTRYAQAVGSDLTMLLDAEILRTQILSREAERP